MSPVTDEMYVEVSKKFSKDIKIVGVDSNIKQKVKEKKAIEEEKKLKELREYKELLKISSMIMTEIPRRRKRTEKLEIDSKKTPIESEEVANAESESIDNNEQEQVIKTLETETNEEVIPSLEIKQPAEDIKNVDLLVTQNALTHDDEDGNAKNKIKIYDENILYSNIETLDSDFVIL